MSTKNLSRTVIEGGRVFGNAWDRRNSNARLRARERAVETQLRHDTDRDIQMMPKRIPVRPNFHDKLSPARRWLERQAGRPWDKVRGELLALFDTRTTAGRHIVFDHMLPWVEQERFGRWAFTVDKHGILRHQHWKRRKRPEKTWSVWPNRAIKTWINGRRIGERGTFLFWFTLTPSGFFRQDRRLDDAESTLWRSLSPGFRKENSDSAPPLLEPRKK